MLTVAEIIKIINECRIEAKQGLGNGTKAIMDEITVDFLEPPSDFLGVHNNPAIFINASTYKYLQRFHQTWVVNRTIAVKIEIFDYPKINIIGIVTHETGHAFNIAAGLKNSEDNAYIFEIEILARWFMMKNKILSDISKEELLGYFQTRMPYYKTSVLIRFRCLLTIRSLKKIKC